MLEVASALVAHPDVAKVGSFGPERISAEFKEVGVQHFLIDRQSTDEEDEIKEFMNLARRSFIEPLSDIVTAVELASEFNADVVLYDPFSVYGYIAAQELGIPSAALITFPGLGALGDSFIKQHSEITPSLRRANQRYMELFDLDMLGEGLLPVFFPSAHLSIVTTIETLALPLNEQRHPLLYSRLGHCQQRTVYAGPCVRRPTNRSLRYALQPNLPWHDALLPDPQDGAGTLSNEPTVGPRSARMAPWTASSPTEMIRAAKREGKRVVLFSLGTVITDTRFNSPVGGASTGREFLITMLRYLVQAFADRPDFLVIAAIGTRLQSNDVPAWPANFMTCSSCPQVELLETVVDVFITHHGANSTLESLLAGVPMVSVPGAGDQIPGARIAIGCGAAVALWDLSNPFETCSADALWQATQLALSAPHRRACLELKARLRDIDGPANAAHHVVSLARSISPEVRPKRPGTHTDRSESPPM